MSWTDDRVSLLTKLWGEGHTAAEIAKQLGGVTRNAVIGKAHRLKLSNRVSPIQQNSKTPKAANKNEPRATVPRKVSKAAPVKKAPKVVQYVEKTPIEQRDDLYSLMDLKPRMCRWPCGDPREENFGFCGEASMPGLPYCAEHAKLAYQAATRNRIFKEDKETAKVRAQLVVKDDKKAAG